MIWSTLQWFLDSEILYFLRVRQGLLRTGTENRNQNLNIPIRNAIYMEEREWYGNGSAPGNGFNNVTRVQNTSGVRNYANIYIFLLHFS